MQWLGMSCAPGWAGGGKREQAGERPQFHPPEELLLLPRAEWIQRMGIWWGWQPTAAILGSRGSQAGGSERAVSRRQQNKPPRLHGHTLPDRPCHFPPAPPKPCGTPCGCDLGSVPSDPMWHRESMASNSCAALTVQPDRRPALPGSWPACFQNSRPHIHTQGRRDTERNAPSWRTC